MCKIKEILIEQKKHIRFGEWSANDVRWFFFYYFQEAMCKIKELLVDEKRHIRFGDWKDKEVNNVCYTKQDDFWGFTENYFPTNNSISKTKVISSNTLLRFAIWWWWRRRAVFSLQPQLFILGTRQVCLISTDCSFLLSWHTLRCFGIFLAWQPSTFDWCGAWKSGHFKAWNTILESKTLGPIWGSFLGLKIVPIEIGPVIFF